MVRAFEEQFNIPSASVQSDAQPTPGTWTVNLNPPSISEICEAISSLKCHWASGPDNLPPALLKDGGECLIQCLTCLFTRIWETETVPDNWSESIIVPIFKEGSRSECSNHKGISLTSVVTRILASLILRRHIATHEASIREEQAGFWPGRRCIDHMFTLRQILEQRHAFRCPTILVFLAI